MDGMGILNFRGVRIAITFLPKVVVMLDVSGILPRTRLVCNGYPLVNEHSPGKSSCFSHKYNQNGGFSMAMLVSGRVLSKRTAPTVSWVVPLFFDGIDYILLYIFGIIISHYIGNPHSPKIYQKGSWVVQLELLFVFVHVFGCLCCFFSELKKKIVAKFRLVSEWTRHEKAGLKWFVDQALRLSFIKSKLPTSAKDFSPNIPRKEHTLGHPQPPPNERNSQT